MLNRILIDAQAFAERGDSLSGSVALQDLDPRLHHADWADMADRVDYRISGGKDARRRPYLQLSVSGSLKLICQRCFKPSAFALDEQARIVLFADEGDLDRAMAADEELEGMTVQDPTDVFSLLEDQILMALPIAPRHETCTDTPAQGLAPNRPNPFAALAGLHKTD